MVRISNEELVSYLMENSRTSYVELARRLKVSDTAVRKKIAKLEKTGVIRKYSIEVDQKKLGYEINAVTGVDTDPEKYISVINEIKQMPQVKRLYSSSGDHMIMAEGWFRNNQDLTDWIQEVESIHGVKKTCPAIIHEKIK